MVRSQGDAPSTNLRGGASRQHHDETLRRRSFELHDQVKTGNSGSLDVQNHGVGSLLEEKGSRLTTVLSLADDTHVSNLGDHSHQALADDGTIVHDQNAERPGRGPMILCGRVLGLRGLAGAEDIGCLPPSAPFSLGPLRRFMIHGIRLGRDRTSE